MLVSIDKIREAGIEHKHLAVAKKLEDKHLCKLLQERCYRARVEEDKALLWKHLDRFSFVHDTIELELARCPTCHRNHIRHAGERRGRLLSGCGLGCKTVEYYPFWISKDNAAHVLEVSGQVRRN